MKILITGSDGLVGRHFWNLLKTPENELYGNDIKSTIDCRELFKICTGQFDLVIHCAAIVGGRMNIENDPIAVATDLAIDSDFFNWAVRTKQPKVVYFSSSAAYPTFYQMQTDGIYDVKLHESQIQLDNIHNPDMTYGWAKLTGEMLAEYARKQGVKVYVFRPFSGYAEDQDLDYPFPSFIKRIKDKVSEFEIWGNGTACRDFIHIDDVCEAVMKAVELDIQEPINIGNGRATSFNELAQMCMEIGEYKVPIKHLLDKPVGVQYRVSDNTKMLEFYQPKISLEEGITRCLKS